MYRECPGHGVNGTYFYAYNKGAGLTETNLMYVKGPTPNESLARCPGEIFPFLISYPHPIPPDLP